MGNHQILVCRQQRRETVVKIIWQKGAVAGNHQHGLMPASRQAADNAGQWPRVIQFFITDQGITQTGQRGLIAIAVNQNVVHLRCQPLKHMRNQRAAGKIDQGLVNAAQAGGTTAGQDDGRAGNGGH